MRIVEIYTEELPHGWEWTPDSYLGGTPEFVVNTAEAIKKFARVTVYYDGKPMEHNGVYYLPRVFYGARDILLACNSRPPRLAKHNIVWCDWVDKKDSDYAEFDERIVISPYHQSIFGNNSRIVPLSVHKSQFFNAQKVKGQCLYSSSPDRGGEFLKSIWKDVEAETGAKLIQTYKKDISEADMIKLYKESEFWLHPCQGVELFCIAAAKAQTAGCIPVVIPNMALDTTVKFGVKTTLENYKQDLINAIKNPPPIASVDFGSWESVTKDLFKAVI